MYVTVEDRRYWNTAEVAVPTCEHCCGSYSPLVRLDPVRRGYVCPVCDGILDGVDRVRDSDPLLADHACLI